MRQNRAAYVDVDFVTALQCPWIKESLNLFTALWLDDARRISVSKEVGSPIHKADSSFALIG